MAALAQALIGCTLTIDGVGGIIVETEAYHSGDPASHSYIGPRPRTAVMFGEAGRLYVCRSYGRHWCMNIVGGSETAAAVLFRAVEPLHGVDVMAARRGKADPLLLCSGPGRLCAALGVTDALNGAPVNTPPVVLGPRLAEPEIVAGPRIGITKATDEPWRFGLAGSRYLSRRFPVVLRSP